MSVKNAKKKKSQRILRYGKKSFLSIIKILDFFIMLKTAFFPYLDFLVSFFFLQVLQSKTKIT